MGLPSAVPTTGLGGSKYISFEERQWHNNCFNCKKCNESLVGRGFLTFSDDLYCPDCGKDLWGICSSTKEQHCFLMWHLLHYLYHLSNINVHVVLIRDTNIDTTMYFFFLNVRPCIIFWQLFTKAWEVLIERTEMEMFLLTLFLLIFELNSVELWNRNKNCQIYVWII